MGGAASNDISNQEITSISGQYVDLKTCQKLCGNAFDEKLFEIFSIKVCPKDLLQQLLSRPTLQDLIQCKQQLFEILREKSCAPLFVRAAWHDSGTYNHYLGLDHWPHCGGANGSLRFELLHGSNAGLQSALNLLQPLKDSFPSISWADLLQLASSTAIEFSGGPKIILRFGRIDATSADMAMPPGNLPPAAGPWKTTAQDKLREIFYRMGFGDKEIVVLSGAHTLGRARPQRSGFGKEITPYTTEGACPFGERGQSTHIGSEGGTSWTINWLQFDNSYFQNLLSSHPDEDLLQLETDRILVEDPSFKQFVVLYANDQDLFFRDYIEAHRKLSELGSYFLPSNEILEL